MKNYLQAYLPDISPDRQEILIALLENIGFYGFEEEDAALKAFIAQEDFDEQSLKALAEEIMFTYSVELIKDRNWNALWESNFEPVVVDDFVSVRASFHQPIVSTKHEILITPKMSFGTGHHATTYMMMQQMRDIDFFGKSVFDFGTGTGVLAILAEKLGAEKVLAVDIDDWSIENAAENIEANGSSAIRIEKAENASVNETFDIILANINKNVISDNANTLAGLLNIERGILLLSGLLKEDENEIVQVFSELGLKHEKTLHKNQWISIRLAGK